MTCPCCESKNINDLDNTFGTDRARRDAKKYLRRGLDTRAEKLIAFVSDKLAKDATVLEVGCGAGGVHQELLRRQVAVAAVGVDASSSYLAAAQENAGTLGLVDQVVYLHGDFAQSAEFNTHADLVLLDRVICCYPDLQALLGKAAAHTQQYLAISFPIDRWWVRLVHHIGDLALKLTGSGYHPYVHAYEDIVAVAAAAGLQPVHSARRHIWQIAVFERI
ncbi:MAG: class I SAM-dependent methyltransferase [Candidatus Promineifilaceae bacterium]